MDNLIHILHLEDDAADAELVQATLESAGMVCQISLVQTRDEFSESLSKGGYDVILADYRLPMYDGMSALLLVKELKLDVPFIFVSGTMGEDAAIEALTKGATDYVLKQKLSRLSPALKRALHEAENQRGLRRAEEALQSGERQMKAIVDGSPIPQFVIDKDHRIIHWNRALEEYSGIKSTDVIGTNQQWRAFYSHERPCMADLLVDGSIDQIPQWYEGKFSRSRLIEDAFEATDFFPAMKGGTWLYFTAAPIRDADGNIIGAVETLADVTERKRAEEATEGAKNYLEKIIDSVADPIFVKDRQHRWVLLNQALCSFMGYDRNELLGKTDHDFFPKSEADVFWSKDEVVFETGEENVNEEKFSDARGVVHTISTKKTLYRDENGAEYIVGIIRDVTEIKGAESLIRDSEEKFRTLVDNLNVGVYRNTGDLHGRFIQANPAMIKMFGYDSLEEFMKIAVSDLYQDPEERRRFIEEIRRYGHVKDKELALRKKDGSPMWASTSATAQKDEYGEIKWMDSVVEDITERKKIEVALRESEQMLKAILHGSPIATFVINRDHRVIHWNDALEQLSGIKADTIVGTKDQWMAFYERERPCLADLIVDGSLKAIPDWYSGKYTESKLIDEAYEATDFFPSLGDKGKWLRSTAAAIRNAAGELIGAIETLEDITDRILAEEGRKRLETQLAQAQKMEAIGTLAGGIAHDFNNILSAIIGYTQLAMLDLQDKEKAENELNEVLKAGGRAKDLVSHILIFSRKTETEYSPLELPSIIKESIKMLRSVIPTSIEIRQDLIKSGLVMSDPTQIHQVIINLCTNAAQAMDETGGVLEVSLKKITINGDAAAHDLDLSPGHYFRLTVRDTGHGMPSEVMERIFEPYFTTKELGRGTGLGLSVVHGIVKNHQGAIICKSTPGEGTTFDIYLPELESGKEALKPLYDKLLQTGTERLLFIDDEPVLVDMAKKMLGDLGYKIFAVTSSIEALEAFKRDPNQFDLVITDMTMPAMTGDKLAQKIMDIRRDIPVILCTGYSEHISEERAKSIGIREFIMKPLEIRSLSETIRKVLDIR